MSSGQIVRASLTLALRASRRIVLRAVLVTAMICASAAGLQEAIASGDVRTLSLHHVHRGDNLTVTFKRNGQYDADGLKKLNYFLRDWRNDEQTEMDPELFDAVWEVTREFGGNQTLHVISAYRSPGTNAMLRDRSDGVARESLHMRGQAMDFFVPGISLERVRMAGLRVQRGGVGFYPTSGSPFVHVDVGSVRHWPRMSREQLVRVFPDQRTVHIPADGKPLAGYDLALADVSKRGGSPSPIAVAARNNDGGSKLARLFGFGQKTETPERKDKAPAAPVQVASVRTQSFSPADAPLPVAAPARTAPANQLAALDAIVPLPKGRPSVRPAIATLQVAAALPAAPAAEAVTPNEIIAARGFWQGIPDMAVETSAVETSAARRKTGDDAPVVTASIGAVPASALESDEMEDGDPEQISDLESFGHYNTPWMRAAMMTPSVETTMTTTMLGAPDIAGLRHLMAKPRTAIVLSFAADMPHHGMSHKNFSGHAVHFLTTTTFVQRTASLN